MRKRVLKTLNLNIEAKKEHGPEIEGISLSRRNLY